MPTHEVENVPPPMAEVNRFTTDAVLMTAGFEPSEAEQLIEALRALHPDEMSPREALEALYALKAKLPKTS